MEADVRGEMAVARAHTRHQSSQLRQRPIVHVLRDERFKVDLPGLVLDTGERAPDAGTPDGRHDDAQQA